MLELEQLIRKFWANETTLAENQRLLQLLEQYGTTVKDSMQENFQDNSTGSEYMLQPDKALSILQKIHGGLGMTAQHPALVQQPRRATLRKLYRRIAVAASIGIVAASSFLLIGGHYGKQPAATTVALASAAPAPPRLMRLANGADSVLPVTLKDGSTVQLGKNSSLCWYEPFVNSRRDLSLTGTALFKVAKDRLRPFTVYAGGIATTALGTRFWVNATDAGKTRVRLLEGKVMVNAATGSGMTMNNVYLAPGQEFSFDRHSRQYAVNIPDIKPDNTGRTIRKTDPPELIFKKEPLGSVFRKVASLYNVSLSFRNEELNGLYFTGTFLKSDNLTIVLSTICNVNDLLVTKKEDSIIITKSH